MTPTANPVINLLRRLCELDDDAIALITRQRDIQEIRAGERLSDENRPCPRFLLSGWAARLHVTPENRRQLIGFYLPGDPIGVSKRLHPLAEGAVVALTPVRTCDAGEVVAELRERPQEPLARALRAAACLAEAYLINQAIRLGGLSAYQRICHLFLELHQRMELNGLAGGRGFPFPLTQETLGEATSLSTVHVNRTIQELRRGEMLDFAGGLAILPDPEAAGRLCGYRSQDLGRWSSAA